MFITSTYPCLPQIVKDEMRLLDFSLLFALWALDAEVSIPDRTNFETRHLAWFIKKLHDLVESISKTEGLDGTSLIYSIHISKGQSCLGNRLNFFTGLGLTRHRMK